VNDIRVGVVCRFESVVLKLVCIDVVCRSKNEVFEIVLVNVEIDVLTLVDGVWVKMIAVEVCKFCIVVDAFVELL
jgi:hypothetical protein